MVPGGRVFVWPIIQRVQRISLNTMTLSIESARVYTQQGVPISVTGIAQVKIQVYLRLDVFAKMTIIKTLYLDVSAITYRTAISYNH